MYKQIKNNKGFTIIEVMIVLAIAALILIIVLLAVPALQRNAKNTTIKNDASTVAGAVTEYESNNNGQVPVLASQLSAGQPAYISYTGGNAAVKAVVSGNTLVSAIGTIANPATESQLASALTVPNTILLAPGEQCADITQGAIQGAPTPDNASVSVYYVIDESGGWFPGGCIQS
jgi:prepilin-type N-terminal cleavage/methylation domain-containing protein